MRVLVESMILATLGGLYLIAASEQALDWFANGLVQATAQALGVG